ncbi:MAG: threonylcarbamoyl-AMP synthase [Flavobacteriales bacterium]|nr:threonylcarbamoyl-AMP synthase [Flavobacteriales bacterium]
MATEKELEIEQAYKAIEILKEGGVILYPTDTIWGLGCDANNEKAVQKIFDIKQRSEQKSMIILVANDAQLNRCVHFVPEMAWDLIDVTDSPLTIIYSGPKNIAQSVLAFDGSVGIRMVKKCFANELTKRFNKPLVATSANISDAKTPLSFNEIDPKIMSAVDYVVNLPSEMNRTAKPSAIIKVNESGDIKIIRE